MSLSNADFHIKRNSDGGLEKITISASIEYTAMGRISELEDDSDSIRNAVLELHKEIDRRSGFIMTSNTDSIDNSSSIGESEDIVEKEAVSIGVQAMLDGMIKPAMNNGKAIVVSNEDIMVQAKYDYMMDRNNFTHRRGAFPVIAGVDIPCEEHGISRSVWRNPKEWHNSSGQENVWIGHNKDQARKITNGRWCPEHAIGEKRLKELIREKLRLGSKNGQ